MNGIENVRPNFKDTLILSFGYTGILIPKVDLELGFKLPFIYNGIQPPIELKFVNNKLFVNAEVFSIEQNILASVENNEWRVPAKDLEINYDATGFEIVGSQDIPLLQIDIIDSSTIYLGGVFFYQDNLLILSEIGISIIPNITRFYVDEQTRRKFIMSLSTYRPHLTKIFKYAGSNSFGERNLNKKYPKILLYTSSLISNQ